MCGTSPSRLVLIGRKAFDTLETEVNRLYRHTVIKARPLAVHVPFRTVLLRPAALVLDFLLRLIDSIRLGRVLLEQSPLARDIKRTNCRSDTSRSSTTAHSRSFLRYLQWESLFGQDLAQFVPKTPCWRHARLPPKLAWECVRRAIDAIESTSSSGMRDRAIMLLLATRVCAIRNCVS